MRDRLTITRIGWFYRMTTKYRQCHLAKCEPAGLQQIAWIPAPFAVVGKIIRLKEDNWAEWGVLWVSVDEIEEESIAPYAYGQIRRMVSGG